MVAQYRSQQTFLILRYHLAGIVVLVLAAYKAFVTARQIFRELHLQTARTAWQ